jgi:hypothetical protein
MRFTPGIVARPAAVGGGPPAPTGVWEPLTGLGSSLIAWWTADAGVVGSPVSSWTDRKLGMAVTATSGARPTLGTINGKTALSFSGSNYLKKSAPLTGLPFGATPGELWTVMFRNALGGSPYPFGYGSQSALAGTGDRMFAPAPGGTNYNMRVMSNAYILTDAGADPGPAQILCGWFGNLLMGGRVNGRDFVPASMATTAHNTGEYNLVMGGSLGNSTIATFNGLERHNMITSLLTANLRLQLEGYFAHDSLMTAELPSDHPYKTLAP